MAVVKDGKLKIVTLNIDEKVMKTEKDERETWGNQCEFFLSCLGYAIGLGNVWRFPYLAYKNGGAVFLIPYGIMVICAGLPLFFLDLAIGQYVSLGPNIIFTKLAPIFSGLGWGMLVISFIVSIYYNMILAWTIFYSIATFQAMVPTYTGVLPWSYCHIDYSSVGCFTRENNIECSKNGTTYYNSTCTDVDDVCRLYNGVRYNLTHCSFVHNGTFSEQKSLDLVASRLSASEDYFKNRMLGVTGKSWDDMGGLRWELVGCLALAWVIVCLCMIKGVKSSGKVVYFTALFPYVVLVILFIRGITLDGAYDGIEFYFLKPNMTKLYEVTVWKDAATQIFYSLGSSFGGLITLASYNKFKHNCMRDAIIIVLCNASTSVFAGFVIFSILGFMAKDIGKEVKDVVSSGSGLAFVAYPEAVARMPVAPLWALLFFTMLIAIGLDTQFTMVETVLTAIFDQFKSLRPKKPLVVILTSFVMFLLGLTMCLDGGIFMFELFDWYSAGLSVVILAFTEVLVVHYFYGFRNFISNIKEMGIYIPAPLYAYWAVTWCFITPSCLILIFCFSLYYWAPASFGGYTFPSHIQGLGWAICASSIVLLPLFAIYTVHKFYKNGTPWKKLIETHCDYCPSNVRRLRKLERVLYERRPDAAFRNIQDDQSFDDPAVKVYPKVGDARKYENSSYVEGERRSFSRASDQPPPYSD